MLLFEISRLFLYLDDVELTLFISREVFKRLDEKLKNDRRIFFSLYDVPRTSGRTNFYKNVDYGKAVSAASRDIKNKINSDSFDMVIFETLQGLPFLRSSYKNLRLIKSKKSAIVHNTDVWAGEKRNVSTSLKVNDLFSHFYFKRWLKNLDYLITLEDAQTEYMEKRTNFDRSNIITLRGKFAFEEDKNDAFDYSKEDVFLVIPGNVDQTRRDYLGFLKIFKKFANENENVIVYLLGKMLDQDIKKYVLSSGILKDRVKFWDDFVPNEEFEQIISIAHFVFLPVAGSYRYGITKITGPLYDALVKGKPVIISNNVYVNPKYQKAVFSYDSSNLSGMLKKSVEIVKNGEYSALVKDASEVMNLFKPENFLGEISKMFSDPSKKMLNPKAQIKN